MDKKWILFYFSTFYGTAFKKYKSSPLYNILNFYYEFMDKIPIQAFGDGGPIVPLMILAALACNKLTIYSYSFIQ